MKDDPYPVAIAALEVLTVELGIKDYGNLAAHDMLLLEGVRTAIGRLKREQRRLLEDE